MNFKEWLISEELKSANAPKISLIPKAKPINVESNLHKLKNDQKIAALGRHFKENDGKEPTSQSNLGMWLYSKRRAFRDYEEMKKDPNYKKTTDYKWYYTDLKVAQDAGLPDDWHLFTDKYKPEDSHKLKNDQRIAALGRYFKDNDGKEPHHKSTLGEFLSKKRRAFRDYENMQKNPNYPRNTNTLKWYDTDLQVAKNAGLPDDWHTNTEKYKPENKQLQDFKKINDQNLVDLGVYYKKFGEPNTESNEGKFLYNKRRAYQDFINNTNTTNTKWYDTDEQVGINAGLPEGWHLPVEKQKLSQGEMQIRHVLDAFKIEHETQGTDQECVGQSGQCLRFDFSFDKGDPEEPIRYFIEYHGQQHYYPVLKTRTKNRQEYAKLALNIFEGVQYRDKLKYNYCKQQKFPLLVIPYWIPFTEFKKIIKEFLKHDFDEENFDEKIFDIFANPEVPEDLKEKHKQIYKKYYDMSINIT